MTTEKQLTLADLPIRDQVDSLNHPLALYLQQLLDRQERLKQEGILIDDLENIAEALRCGVKLTGLFVSGENLELPKHFVEQLPADLPIYEIASRTCKKLFQKDRMSRLFAVAKLPKKESLDRFMQGKTDIIVLDGLSIAGNIGAIIRTATALEVGGIVVLNAEFSDVYDRRVIRASRGYVFRTPTISLSTEALLKYCKENQVKLLALSAQGKKTINQVFCDPARLAIILGAEKEGCSPELQQQADVVTKIPMSPHVESFNVSVAAGIVLYGRKFYQLPQK